MTTKLEPLNLRITGSSRGLSAELGKSRREVKNFANSVEQEAERISGDLRGIVGKIAVPVLGGAGVGFGLGLAADAEQTKVAFDSIIGSSSEAKKFLEDIYQFASDTPFQTDQLVAASQALLGFRFSTEKTREELSNLGNIAAALRLPIEELSLIFGQAASRGVITNEILEQFAIRAIPVYEVLARQLGVTRQEVHKLATEGKIGFADLDQAIATIGGTSEFYLGAMEELAKTLGGRWSTLVGNALLLATEWSSVLLPVSKELVSSMNDLVQFARALDIETVELTAEWTAFGVGLVAAGVAIPKVVKVGKDLVTVLRQIAKGAALVQAVTGPKGWLTLAASMGVAAGAAYAVDQIFEEFKETQEEAEEGSEEFAEATKKVAEAHKRVAESASEAEKETKDWVKRAESFRASLATPLEKYTATINELSQAVREGGLEWEFFQRGVAKAVDELNRADAASKPQRPKALLEGSAEAKLAEFEFRNGLSPGAAAADQDREAQKQIQDEVAKLKEQIEADKQAAQELEAELAEAALVAAEANVDQLTQSLKEATAAAREAVQEAERLSDVSLPTADSFSTGASRVGKRLSALAKGAFTLNVDGAFIDAGKQQAFESANLSADKAIEQALKAEQALLRAQQEAEAARQAAADANTEKQINRTNELLEGLQRTIANQPQRPPLDL